MIQAIQERRILIDGCDHGGTPVLREVIRRQPQLDGDPARQVTGCDLPPLLVNDPRDVTVVDPRPSPKLADAQPPLGQEPWKLVGDRRVRPVVCHCLATLAIAADVIAALPTEQAPGLKTFDCAPAHPAAAARPGPNGGTSAPPSIADAAAPDAVGAP